MLLAGDLTEEKCILVAPPEGAKPGDRATFKGITPSEETRELKRKDFEKIELFAKNSVVYVGESALEVNGNSVTCAIPDGAGIH
jgi:methionyl-tRNA synthetase